MQYDKVGFLLPAGLVLACASVSDPGPNPATSASAVPMPPAEVLVVTAKNKAEFRQVAEARRQLCPTVCKKSEALGCRLPYAECLANCTQMDEQIVCPNENDSYVRCMVKQPDTAFTCTPQGFAALQLGYCLAETQSLRDCARKALQSGRP